MVSRVLTSATTRFARVTISCAVKRPYIGISGPSIEKRRHIRCRAVEEKQEQEVPTESRKLFDELVDGKEFGKRGEGYFIAQAILNFLVVFPPSGLADIVNTLGWVLLFLGLGTIVAGSISLGDNLTPLPKPRDGDHTLITDGMYSYMRHPMYGGVLIGSLGFAVGTDDATRLFLVLLLFFVMDRKADHEEKFLLEKYGSEYVAYQGKVKKLLPWLY